MNDEGYEVGRKAFTEGRGFLDNPWISDGDEAHEIKGRRFVDGMVDEMNTSVKKCSLCQSAGPLTGFDGKPYCIKHVPSQVVFLGDGI